MKILSQRDVKLHLMPGDTLVLYDTVDGKCRELLQQYIAKAMTVDVVMAVEIEDGDLGLKGGIAGVFGKKKTELS